MESAKTIAACGAGRRLPHEAGEGPHPTPGEATRTAAPILHVISMVAGREAMARRRLEH